MGTSLVGSTLGRFRVDRLLGRGGMGVVYAAFDTKLERDVALKVLNEDGDVAVAVQKKRLLREARLAARLTHPSIATVYEVDEIEGRLTIVMELLEGPTLRSILSQRRMTVDEAVSVARDMARALAKAHGAGVLHRDIKPENVLVTSPSPDALLAKVLDFGLARQRPQPVPNGASPTEATSTDTTSRGDMWGTPGYVSPEQAHGQPVDVRTDVFSFGIVLYEMLSGTKPFRGENPIAVMIATSKREAQPLRELVPDLPPELDAIVRRCLMKSRDARYADGGELSAALEAFVRGGSARLPNVLASSPSLPAIEAAFRQGSDPGLSSAGNGGAEEAPTTGGSAAIEITARDEPLPPSLEQQRNDHMKLVAAVGGGVAFALVIIIVAVSWISAGSHARSSRRAGSGADAAASAQPFAAAPAAAPSPPPAESDEPAPSTSAEELDPPAASSVAAHPVPTGHGPVRPATKKTRAQDCAEPFTRDAKGVKIPKLHCLN